LLHAKGLVDDWAALIFDEFNRKIRRKGRW
jgi:hypothetical protein